MIDKRYVGISVLLAPTQAHEGMNRYHNMFFRLLLSLFFLFIFLIFQGPSTPSAKFHDYYLGMSLSTTFSLIQIKSPPIRYPTQSLKSAFNKHGEMMNEMRRKARNIPRSMVYADMQVRV